MNKGPLLSVLKFIPSRVDNTSLLLTVDTIFYMQYRMDFVGTDPPSMRDLNRYVVKTFATKWKDIGLELGLELPILNNIEVDCNRVANCFQIMLDKWLRSSHNATWDMLEIAITNVERQDLQLPPVENLYGKEHV